MESKCSEARRGPKQGRPQVSPSFSQSTYCRGEIREVGVEVSHGHDVFIALCADLIIDGLEPRIGAGGGFRSVVASSPTVKVVYNDHFPMSNSHQVSHSPPKLDELRKGFCDGLGVARRGQPRPTSSHSSRSRSAGLRVGRPQVQYQAMSRSHFA